MNTTPQAQEDKPFILNRVKLAFPAIFEQAKFNGESTGKFEATLLIPKEDTASYNLVNAEIDRISKEVLKKRPSVSHLCLSDGDDSDNASFAGYWKLKVSSKRRPAVVNKDKSPLVKEDNVIYAGCIVNASVSLWGQNNAYGKRVNANLFGVQFVEDAEGFASSHRVDVLGQFEVIEDATPAQPAHESPYTPSAM